MAKVVVGFFSFTEITDPSEHRSYNEWHQLDHMPEQYPLPGVIFGQRWVSTPVCRRARAYDDPGLAPVHYMTLYLMGEQVDTTLEDFHALGQHLRDAGRFHGHRRSRLSGPFAVTGQQAAPRVLVSAEAVPYRPNRGVYVVVRDLDSPAATASGSPTSRRSGAEVQDGRLATAMLEHDGVAGVWTFGTDSRFDRHPWRPGHKTVTVCYLDEEPLTVSTTLNDLVRADLVRADSGRANSGRVESGRVVWAGPMETITPWRWDWFDEHS